MLVSRTLRVTPLSTCHRRLCPRIFFFFRPGRSVGSLERRRYTSHTNTDEADISEPDDGFFGTYSIILPLEPFVFGVSHIAQRPVPPHIPRPPYVPPSSSDQHGGTPSTFGDGRIQLGSSEERRLRSAGRLARNVLEYAGTLVKVKADRHCIPLL